MIPKLYLILYCLTVIGLYSMSIWGGWAEKHYDRAKSKKNLGFWLRLFGKDDTKENCVKFMKAASAFVISMMIITLIMLVSLE